LTRRTYATGSNGGSALTLAKFFSIRQKSFDKISLLPTIRPCGGIHSFFCPSASLDDRRQDGYPGTSMGIGLSVTRLSAPASRLPSRVQVATAALACLCLIVLAHPTRLCEAAVVPTGAPTKTPSTLRVVTGPDGTLELRDGDRALTRLPALVPAGNPGPASVEEVATQGRKVVVVRRPTKEKSDKSNTAAWVGVIEPEAISTIWSGVLGPLDADGEVTRTLEAGPAGVALYETASRISRCDRAAVRLAWRQYDFARRRFEPVIPPPPAPAPAPIVARRGAGQPRPRPRIAFPFTVASAAPAEASGGEDARTLVAPLAISDGDRDTVWRERIATGPGGILTARAAGSGFAITGIEVLPGDPTSPQRWAQSGRAKAFSIILGPAATDRFDVTLEEAASTTAADHRRPFWIPLPRPVASSCVTIVPRELTRSTQGPSKTLAWSEITVFTDFDGPTGVARLIKTLADADCASRVDDVVALGATSAPALVAELTASPAPSANGRRCLLDALGRLGAESPGLGAEASQALQTALPAIAAADLDAEEERLLGQILTRLPATPLPPLRGLLGNALAPETARVRAARWLSGLDDPAAHAAIVDAVGSEPAALRAQLRRLAAATPGGTPALRAAIISTPATSATRRADLSFALGTAATKAAAGQADRLELGNSSTLLAGLALDAQLDFEVRARAVQALGAIADDRSVEALIQLSQKGDPPPLRLLSTQGLGRVGKAKVLPALRTATNDPDPAVREAAVIALGVLRDKAANDLLIAGAKQEPWPQVRRAEIAALGRVCGPGAGDLLLRAVERDVLDVRKVALAGLSACRDPRTREVLLGLLRREPEAPPLRTQAALLLGQSGDRAVAPEMAAALSRMTVQAQADLAIEETALTTVDALARLGGPAAEAAILALRSDERPSFRRAAVQALGRACDAPKSKPALLQAMRDSDAAVASAARASLRRCEGGAAGRPVPPVLKTKNQ
jgi:HEAT repeat protein